MSDPVQPPQPSGPPHSWTPDVGTPGYGTPHLAPPPYIIPTAALPVLPVVETDYIRFFVSPRFRWWKSLLALVVGGGVGFIAMVGGGLVGMFADGLDYVFGPDGTIRVGPWTFIWNNLGLAAATPIAMFAAWVFIGQRPGWLSSVTGTFRWRWFARVIVVLLPIWAVMVGVETLVARPELAWRESTMLMIVGVLLTTPLQAAGEEYMTRGFLARCVGAWFRNPKVAFAVSTAFTALIFMALHGAGDPWLNAFYLVFAAAGSWLVVRTGGLEAAVALHIVNNVLAMVVLPFSDFSDMFERGEGAGDPSVLINMAVIVGATALIDWLARRRGLTVRSAPGRMPVPPPPRPW